MRGILVLRRDRMAKEKHKKSASDAELAEGNPTVEYTS
jgi:hypothetical protein